MKHTDLKICNEIIKPGENVSLALPMPEIFSCAPLYMPIKIIHGKKPGPCLLITAAMHGNELNGTEIINRLLNSKELKQLNGTLIAVPVLNVYGLINRSRTLPGGIELDRCFPGTKIGTNASRLAHIFINEIFNLCDYCIDLQTGFLNHSNLPQIYFNFSDDKSRDLAKNFNAPVISNIACEKGMLRTYAIKNDIPFLTYVAGEAMRFDGHSIKVGVKGILNVMRNLDMIKQKQTKKSNSLKSFFADDNIWVHSSSSGISHSNFKLGQYVKKGENLCVIKDPFGASSDVTIKSPAEGIIVGKNNLPLVHEGEALFQLAVFQKMQHAADHLADWKEKSTENFESKS